MRELGVDWDGAGGCRTRDRACPTSRSPPGSTPSAFGARKYDALAAHASQAENVLFLRLGRDRFTELLGMETFVRVHDTTGAPVPEDDLFAGLRG